MNKKTIIAVFEMLLIISFNLVAVSALPPGSVPLTSSIKDIPNKPTTTNLPTGKTEMVGEAVKEQAKGAAGTAGGEAGGIGGLFTGTAFGKEGFAGIMSGLTSGLIWGAIVGGGAYLLANAFGLNKEQAASVGWAVGGGTFAGTTTFFILQNQAGMQAGTAGLWGLGVGIGVGAGIFLLTYKKEKMELIKFECLAWEPPLGGEDCEKCNNDKMPCSEYRCRSLGQACQIVNKGSENELCVWVGKGDTQAPKITPWNDALKPTGLRYVPNNAISPPNRGFKISGPGPRGCLEAWTQLQFGFTTNEPAQCRISLNDAKNNYDEMESLVGNNNAFSYNHTQKLTVPSPFTEESGDNVIPEIHNRGTYNLYVRCIDANGNGKDSAFVAFSFCVKPGPDTMPPEITGTSILNGRAVQFDVDNVPIEVYTNEPAECKWSHDDKAYEAMENKLNCATEIYQINSDLNYVCVGNLDGIKNKQNNDFYFRCKDQPKKPENERNVMLRSYKLTLRGTDKLIVMNPGPNGTIEGGENIINVTLTVETGFGSDEGKAICYFDNDRNSQFTTIMEKTNDVIHTQTLYLPEGNYRYFFRCVDGGGNKAETETSFSVKTDRKEPLIARVYRDSDSLKIITNEPAKCAYSLTSCNYEFEKATETVFLYENPHEKLVHFIQWDTTKVYYIKCADLRNRLPPPDKCSLIVKGSDL